MASNCSAEEDDVFSALFTRRTGAIKPGLSRMVEALKFLPELSNPAPCTLIAGTNGKGSTAGMLWHLLAVSGFKVGLYTSPHISHFRERIQLSSKELENRELLAALNRLRLALPPELYAELSFFEITTIIAAIVFNENKCDWIIYEVGLGGRWDSTNIFAPSLTAIVSIDFDHQALLGNTLELILAEKLGICRPHVPLFWGQDCSGPDKADLDILVEERASVLNFPIYRSGKNFGIDSSDEVWVDFESTAAIRLKLPTVLASRAPILKKNFALAMALFMATIRHLQPLRGLSTACLDATGKFGKAGFPWPTSLIGRFQYLDVLEASSGSQQRLVIDVCHNVDSVKQLLHSLVKAQGAAPSKKFPAIISIAKDKDIPEMLRLLRSVLAPIVLFKIHNDRAMSREELGAEHQDLALFDNFCDAWTFCWHEWRQLSLVQPWVVCGSFYTVGEVFNHFDVFSKTREKQGILEGIFCLNPDSK